MKGQRKRVNDERRIVTECSLPQAPMAMPEQPLTYARRRRAMGGFFALWFAWR